MHTRLAPSSVRLPNMIMKSISYDLHNLHPLRGPCRMGRQAPRGQDYGSNGGAGDGHALGHPQPLERAK